MNFNEVKSITIAEGNVKSLKVNDNVVWKKQESYVFVPESIQVSRSYASASKKATVNVVTSKDVDYVTINGEKTTGGSISSTKLRFRRSYSNVPVGTLYEVIAYDAYGVASEIYAVIV